jgi:16S rRNA processing protein RimM
LVSFVVVGEVIKPRGVRGELLVRPTTASTERFLSIRSVWIEETESDAGCHGRRRAGRQTQPEVSREERREVAQEEGHEVESKARWKNFPVEWSRTQGELALVKLKGIDSREEAMELNGLTLEVPRSEVPPHPEGEHYMFELVGMKVTRTDGIELGTVADVMETGSNIVYVVKSIDGKETLIPATRDVVERLDYENSEILVRPVPGLFDE